MIRLPLSRTGSAESFDAAVQDHIKALTKHLLGKPGVPAPRADDLIESVILRQPQDGPVAERGPDTFMARPYEIFDDTPVVHMPTLDEKKALLGHDLEVAAAKARAEVLSPARARLLEMDISDVMGIPEQSRSDTDREKLSQWNGYLDSLRVIERRVLEKHLEIEVLTEDTVDGFAAVLGTIGVLRETING